uniref:hypothetical protein n=1 Tax=Pedobacter schmidteae TaxID=2201271 RepID=UPI000EAC17CF|nr:hypothetical protein [Pedobacter schmidteae]
MSTLKKLGLFVLLLFPGNLILAQDRKDGEYNTFSFKGQQNPELWVTMYARKRSWGMGQQFYSIQIENVTDKKLKVKGNYHAVLTCGNEVSSDIDIILGPHEKLGGNSFATDVTGLTASAESEDCKGTPIYENGKQVGTNRIKSVGYRITQITDMNLQQKTVEHKPQPIYKAPSGTATTTSPLRSSGTNTANSSATRNDNGANQRQAIMDNLNRQLEKNRNTTNAIVGGLQQIGNMFQENAERKAAQRRAEYEAEDRREAQKRQQEAIALEKKAEQRAELQRLQSEAADSRFKSISEWDKKCIGNYMIKHKTSEIPQNVNQVYYITYGRTAERPFNITVRTYILNKYSDNTWMLESDMLNKIKFKNGYIVDNEGYLIGLNYLLGFFATKAEANMVLAQIEKNAPNGNIDKSFVQINGAETKIGTDKNFWNN